LDFRGAIHYIRIRGGNGATIFFDPDILKPGGPAPYRAAPDLRRFERLVTAAGQECRAVLHGYSMEPNAGTLVLQSHGAPLAEFMRRLCGQYSHYLRINRRLNEGQCAFATRYESKVVAPEYLPHAVRRAHRAPIVAGHSLSRVDYPFSSERAYVGERASLPLETQEVRRTLQLRGHFGSRGYREFMDAPETPYVAALFDHGAPLDSRIVGGKLYVQQARRLAARPPNTLTRQQLMDAVARLLNIAESEILDSSHTGVLARALVAWFALRSGAATLSTVGEWFSVTGATLGQGIRHYRPLAPHLFDLAKLPELEENAAPRSFGHENEGENDSDNDDTGDDRDSGEEKNE